MKYSTGEFLFELCKLNLALKNNQFALYVAVCDGFKCTKFNSINKLLLTTARDLNIYTYPISPSFLMSFSAASLTHCFDLTNPLQPVLMASEELVRWKSGALVWYWWWWPKKMFTKIHFYN